MPNPHVIQGSYVFTYILAKQLIFLELLPHPIIKNMNGILWKRKYVLTYKSDLSYKF